MTLTYPGCQPDRRDEYAAAARVDALYHHGDDADLTRLRHEHQRMLANGWCAARHRLRSAICRLRLLPDQHRFAPTLQPNKTTPPAADTRVQLYGALLDRLEASR
jgi:hypothetical protein